MEEKKYAPIQTKLNYPQYLHESMQRPRLAILAEKLADIKLLSVIAPPGFGKSTFLAQLRKKLLEEYSEIEVAWLNLDEDDNDPITMTEYICAAFHQLDENIARRSIAILKSGSIRSLKELYVALIEDLYQSKKSFVLFVDDFHVLQKGESLQLWQWFIDHIPEALTIVISSRKKLELKLRKLYLNEEYSSVSARDLQFTKEEVRDFFLKYRKKNISESLLENIAEKTEGWVGALQMLFLIMQESSETESLIENFSGEHRELMDYLSEVVLEQLPEDLRNFILSISVLDRICASLAKDLSGEVNSQEILEDVDQRNLFLIELDNKKNWYRFHHLFRDFIRKQAFKLKGHDFLKNQYQLASVWFESAGYQHEAIHYALAGEDYTRAANLISQFAMNLVINQGDHRTMLYWMKQIPEEYLAPYPMIFLSYAFSLTFTTYFDQARSEIKKLKVNISSLPLTEESSNLLCFMEMNELLIEMFNDKIKYGRELAKSWLKKWPETHMHAYAMTLCVMGVSYFFSSEFEKGYKYFEDAIKILKQDQGSYLYIWALTLQIGICWTHGKLNQTLDLHEKIIAKINKMFGKDSPMYMLLKAAISDVYYEKGDFEEAYKQLKGKKLFVHSYSNTEGYIIYYNVYARMSLYKQDFTSASQYLIEAEKVAQELAFVRFQHQLVLLRIELYLQTDHISQAQQLLEKWEWNQSQDIEEEIEDTNLVIESIFSRLSLARVLIAQKFYSEALDKLKTLVILLRKSGLLRYLLNALIQEVLCYENIGEREKAHSKLEECIKLASEESFISVFLEYGLQINQQIYHLLKSLDLKGIKDSPQMIKFRNVLLKQFEDYFSYAQKKGESSLQLFEQVSTRELEILSILNSSMNNAEIAKSLHISLGTLKWHLHNIYQKLAAKNRSGAVIKAKKLQLI
ncbi:MAG: hypothetical protein H7A32_00205 [Deltaproteobacteria bacterium]|nr:hypothetical protein [Deltaproteobacteria bacterium]